ncbi:hypothetical protein ARMGADRAFT_1020429 [Armillaria gallica]|uniref:Uncharacterized protein n=1 Tax=Armillaria gallica TaxID=47427 RepID=A0A2H3CDY1_ARMGA|nr:hypothetical protein ARMGADRAFT_1020429 [Armillaria gallica]
MPHPPQPSDSIPQPLPANPFPHAAFNICLMSGVVPLPDPRHSPIVCWDALL